MRLQLCALALLACSAISARADLVDIEISGMPSYQYNGYYVGPAKATDNGAGPIDLWCDDFLHTTYVPTTYYANVNTLPSTTTRFYNASSPSTSNQEYKEIAWLIGQYYGMSSGQRTNQSVGDLQFAIWLVFNPTETALQTSGANMWLAKAQTADLGGYNTSTVRIFTPVNCSGTNCAPNNQEFVNAPVPEPTAIVLFGTGAVVAMLAVKRRRRRV